MYNIYASKRVQAGVARVRVLGALLRGCVWVWARAGTRAQDGLRRWKEG
jgi:hypothetical protein